MASSTSVGQPRTETGHRGLTLDCMWECSRLYPLDLRLATFLVDHVWPGTLDELWLSVTGVLIGAEIDVNGMEVEGGRRPHPLTPAGPHDGFPEVRRRWIALWGSQRSGGTWSRRSPGNRILWVTNMPDRACYR